MYYVYVLRSSLDKNLYTGATSNLEIRYHQHSMGKVFATKDRRPLEIIYYEACLNIIDAYKREKYLKSGPGKKYLNGRLRKYLTSLDM